MTNFKIFEVYELTRQSSFTEYGNPEIIVGEEEAYVWVYEDNDYTIIANLKVKEKFIDSEENMWLRIQ